MTGESAVANMSTFNKLSQGIVIPAYVIATSDRDIRVLKLPKQKLSHKVVEDFCLKCNVVNYHNKGIVLAILVKSGFVKLCSLPSLSDIANVKLPKEVYAQVKESLESGMATQSDLLRSGELFVRYSKTESVYITTNEKLATKMTQIRIDCLTKMPLFHHVQLQVHYCGQKVKSVMFQLMI